jgi:predicted RNA-binding protein with PUA-like domain
MNYWLLKSDPDAYGWPEFEKDKRTFWDGVRNYAARNHMKDMKEGDMALFYHSVTNPGVVGIAKIVKEAYQDPTIEDDRWVAVDIELVEKLKNPVSLKQVKADSRLAEMILVKISRLSVQPVKKEEFDIVIELSEIQ